MKKICLTLILILATLPSQILRSENAKGWNLYLAYHDATKNCPTGEEVFALFNGNLLSYRFSDGEVRLFSKLDGLNGRNIVQMEYSHAEQCLVLVYDDLLIDLYYPENGEIVNMPQIKSGAASGVSVRSLQVCGADATLGMSDGIVHIDLSRQEVKGYYVLNQDILAAAFCNETLYAATATELLACKINSNPLDKKQWEPVVQVSVKEMLVFSEKLYLNVDKKLANSPVGKGLHLLNADKNLQTLSNETFTQLYANETQALALGTKQIVLLNAQQPAVPAQTIKTNRSWNDLTLDNKNVFWGTDQEGLCPYQLSADTLAAVGETIGKYGPRRDLCYYMKFVGERLLIAGGRLDPYDRLHYDGTLMTYENNAWKFFQEEGISTQTGVPYRDINCVVQDPNDENHHFATSGGTGLYEFRDYQFVNHISNHNSPIMSATASGSPRYVRLDGLQFDQWGNLWLLNNHADTVVWALKPDGTWRGVFVQGLKNAPTCEQTLIDRNGCLWVSSRRTVSGHDAGLLRLDYKGTVDDTNDDVATYRASVMNQDGTNYLLGGVFCMAEDTDGAIWIGTRVGLFVIANPEEWTSEQFRVTQIKVPRNDGTNLADYLLNGVAIKAIAIDGAGRKWIGTEENGVYLVSHDGTEILQHFQAETSPLLSNMIHSIAIHPSTGEVMIGTEAGLCSIQGNATMPNEMLDENALKVYPNPLRPEQREGVTLTGLTIDADVKVVNAGGMVVAGGRSLGGSFVWDACGPDGRRVKSGVYYFMISTSDGNKGAVAKVVVI